MLFALTLALMLGGTQADAAQATSTTAPTTIARGDETAPAGVPQPSQKAMDYYHSGNVLWAADQVWSLTELIVILATGFSATLRNWSMRIGRRWLFALSAYVAGIFTTKRIVLWDTIIKRMTEPELLFVMGREMGHYMLGLGERIDFVNEYHPWRDGQPLAYGNRFKK